MNNHEEESSELLSSLSNLPGPSPQVVDSILKRSLAGAVVGASVLAQSEAGAAVVSSGGASATAGKALLLSLKAKTLLALGLFSIAGTGVYQVTRGNSESPTLVSDTMVIVQPLEAPSQSPLEEKEVPLQIEVTTTTPYETAISNLEERSSTQKIKTMKKESPSSSEREIIQTARSAISASDSKAAIRALKEHKRFYSRGELAEEREVLWISLLSRDAKLSRAQKRATRFFARFPGSLHSTRIKSEIEAAKKKYENKKAVTDSKLPGQQ